MKLGWDPLQKICKGFAFVTMTTEVGSAKAARTNAQSDAKKAIGLHGTSHKGRLLKVEMNDRNHSNKKALRYVFTIDSNETLAPVVD